MRRKEVTTQDAPEKNPYISKVQREVLIAEVTMRVTGKDKELFATFFFNNQEIYLPSQAEVLLQCFFEKAAQNSGELKPIFVSKAELQQAIATAKNPKPIVSTLISTIRRAFNDAQCPLFIDSKSGQGYILGWVR